jgi:hypothetical protein
MEVNSRTLFSLKGHIIRCDASSLTRGRVCHLLRLVYLSVGQIVGGPRQEAIPGFSLLKIHDKDFCSLIDMYVFGNEASSSTRGGVDLSV